MGIVKNAAELIFTLALFFNSLVFIPQAIKIFKEKTVREISLSTFIGFLLIQLMIVLYGVINQNYPLVGGSLLSMLTCGLVIVLVLIYKKRSASEDTVNIDEVLNQLPGHIYWKNKGGVNLGCNAQNWRDFGVESICDYIGKTSYDMLSKQEADLLRMYDEEVMRTGELKVFEEEITTSDGKKTLYLSHKLPLKNKHNQIIGIIGTSIDITSTKQKTLNDLKVLENIISLMPGHVYWMDADGVYLGCNDNLAKAIGLASKMEIIGKHNKEISGFLIPEVLDPINKEVIDTGKTIITEEPVSIGDGIEGTYLSTKAPLYDYDHNIVGMVATSIDITDRKRAEKLQIEKEISEKITHIVEMMSGCIAHEIRTILAIVGINKDGLQMELKKMFSDSDTTDRKKKMDGFVKSIEYAIHGGEHIISMILIKLHNVLNKHQDVSNFEPNSIKGSINDAINEYPFNVNEHETIVWDNRVNTDFTYVGDKTLTKHIIFNLIKNSLRAIKKTEGGKIHISLASGKKFNFLFFKDTAAGLSRKDIANLFQSLNDKSDTGVGINVGLGLAFCKTVMQSYCGDITCNSKEGEYTEFVLSFPVVQVYKVKNFKNKNRGEAV